MLNGFHRYASPVLRFWSSTFIPIRVITPSNPVLGSDLFKGRSQGQDVVHCPQIIISAPNFYEVLYHFFLKALSQTLPFLILTIPLYDTSLNYPGCFFSGLHAVIKKGICRIFTNKNEVRKNKNLPKSCYRKYHNMPVNLPSLDHTSVWGTWVM